jgi:hypothetical protein
MPLANSAKAQNNEIKANTRHSGETKRYQNGMFLWKAIDLLYAGKCIK